MVLLVIYAGALGRLPGARANTFDPLAPRPHAIEQLLVAGKFSEAFPQIVALYGNYPGEPLVAMWLARAHHGLGHWRDEADAWEAFVRVSPAPQESCPSLPDAYERIGSGAAALAAYERCAQFDPSDPALVADLAAAYARRGRGEEALAAYRRASELAPDDPEIDRRTKALESTKALAEHNRP
jgi:Flp pilus assembly protein TadD